MGRKRKIWGQRKRPKKSKKRRWKTKRTKEPLTEDEQKRILKVAKNLEEFEYRTILVFLDTGMHPCVLADDCRDTDPDLHLWENFILWLRPKNGLKVSLPVSDRLKPWIKEYLEKERPDYRQYYNRLIKRVGEKAKIKGLSPLSFRHTFAVNRLNEGYGLHDLQRFMGTKDLKSLANYTLYSKKYMETRIKGKEW